MKGVMDIIYWITLIVNLIVIPFTYFYGEERQDSFEDEFDYAPDRKSNSFLTRLYISFRNTVLFSLFTSLLLLALYYMHHQADLQKELQDVSLQEWVKQVIQKQNMQSAIRDWVVAVLSCVGSVCWILYGGYGLAVLPINLLRSPKSLQDSHQELTLDLASLRTAYRSI